MDDILYSTITKADIGSNTCPFNNNKFLIFNFALGGAYPVKINGAKEPYNGCLHQQLS